MKEKNTQKQTHTLNQEVQAVGSCKSVRGSIFVRCTGAEYAAFLNDPEIWPEGRYITHMVIRVDGAWAPNELKVSDIPPTAVVEISDEGDVADDSSLDQWGIIDYFNDWKISQRINSALQ